MEALFEESSRMPEMKAGMQVNSLDFLILAYQCINFPMTSDNPAHHVSREQPGT